MGASSKILLQLVQKQGDYRQQGETKFSSAQTDRKTG
jgi:hypothetical protein